MRDLGRTAKLWIQHFDRVLTLLHFIRAERTGDWALHIESVCKMLPTFHAAVHSSMMMTSRNTLPKDTSPSAGQTSSGREYGQT